MYVGAGLTAQSVAFVTNIDDDERISEAGIVYPSCCGSWFFCTPNGRIAIGASNTRREPLVLNRQMNNRQHEFLGFLLLHLTHSGKGPAA